MMLMKYAECEERFRSPYQIHAALHRQEIFRLERGIYATQKIAPEVAIITKKYPNAILTMESAFYYHGFTDDIPERYALATDVDHAKIRDPRIHQYFLPSQVLHVGETTVTIDGAAVPMYDKERMLIELARNKTKLPYDFYKEVLRRYRTQTEELDIMHLQEYLLQFPKAGKIREILEQEVF